MSESVSELSRASKVYIAGHRGLVGSAIWRLFSRKGFSNLIGRSSSQLDLRNQGGVQEFFKAERPDVVIDAAARVGGILANSTYPADFLSDNLRIQLNVMDAAQQVGVPKLLFLGSSCIYPKLAPQPISEDSLMTGPLEPTNDAYAIAKIAGIMQVQSIRRQYGLHYISAMPTNLYGPGDNFHPQNSHVLPAMIRRFHEAKITDAPSIMNWGSGSPRREFLHVDDLASACLFLLEHYDQPQTINVGVGHDMTIAEISARIASVVGYTGAIGWDASKPDGTPQKLLDTSRLGQLGWQPRVSFGTGIKWTYEWFLANQETFRH